MRTFALIVMILVTRSAVSAPVTYDELVDGAIPRSLTSSTPAEIQNFTFSFDIGINTVSGTSEGESFLFQIQPGQYLNSIYVEFYTPVDTNDHVLDVHEVNFLPYLPSPPYIVTVLDGPNLYQATPLGNIGVHAYTLDLPFDYFKEGLYNIYSGTSVEGTLEPMTYSLNFDVKAVPLPATLPLLATGVFAVFGLGRRQTRKKNH